MVFMLPVVLVSPMLRLIMLPDAAASLCARGSRKPLLTVSTLPARAITVPSTLSSPAPGTLVPAYTADAVKVRVPVSKTPVAEVMVPAETAASAVSPAAPA